jgi:hypothetical protein
MKKVSENEILSIIKERPYAILVMQTQMLYDIASMLEEVVGLLSKPKGRVYPIKVTVERTTILDFVNEYPHTPLFSVTVYNDGPNEVYIGINGYQKQTDLKYGENLSIEFTAPKIEKIIFDVGEGKRANIRGFGVY